jgi:DNA-binding CsgD family transcriptional regulator
MKALLTPYELEVITLKCTEGLTYREVAKRIWKSYRTVEGRMYHARKRTGAKTDEQLVYIAMKKGLIS